MVASGTQLGRDGQEGGRTDSMKIQEEDVALTELEALFTEGSVIP